MADNQKPQELTPQGIPTTSFATKVAEYEKLLSEKTTVEEEVQNDDIAIRDFLRSYAFPTEVRQASKLTDLEDKLVIYKKREEEQVEGLVFTAARAEGRAFSEIVSNPPLMKALEKKFGAKFRDFFRQVDDVFHYKTIEKPAVVDEPLTEKAKKEYAKLVKDRTSHEVKLKTLEQKLRNVKEYIDFCKTIAGLAPAPQQKGGGDKNQQGGQQQKPQG